MANSVRDWKDVAQRLPRPLRSWTFWAILASAVLLVGSFWPAGRQLLFALLAFLLAFAVMFSPVVAIALAIASLLSLDRAAKQREAPIQFTLVDFLFLFFLIQMPMALIFGWVPDERTRFRWLLLVYAWGAFGAMWLASTQRLSRAGVRHSGRRALFLGLVLPAAILGTLLSPVLCVIALGGMIRDDWRQAGPALAGQAGLLLVLVVSRRLMPWLVAPREPGNQTAELFEPPSPPAPLPQAGEGSRESRPPRSGP